jgi:hypothetical protein
LDGLTVTGWAALAAYGIRTIIDLRNDDEGKDDSAPRPTDVTTVHLPLDDLDDSEFWDYWGMGLPGTPLSAWRLRCRKSRSLALSVRAMAAS